MSVWILFLIYGIYFGLAEGAEKALVADLVKPEQRGTAYGLYNLAFGITVLPASLLMGALWNLRGPRTAFLVSARARGSAALLLVMLVRRHATGKREKREFNEYQLQVNKNRGRTAQSRRDCCRLTR